MSEPARHRASIRTVSVEMSKLVESSLAHVAREGTLGGRVIRGCRKSRNRGNGSEDGGRKLPPLHRALGSKGILAGRVRVALLRVLGSKSILAGALGQSGPQVRMSKHTKDRVHGPARRYLVYWSRRVCH
jgi:hypothetical protein